MRRALVRLLVGAVPALTVLAPQLAVACATCVSSAYGDRTFNWAYLVLLVMPFGVLCAIAGILAWSAGYRPAQLRTLVRTLIIEERT